MNVVNPVGMPVREWCDHTAKNLQRFVAPMKVDDPKEWREWGTHAVQLLRAVLVSAPDPYTFPDFESWAVRFNQTIQPL